MSRNGVVFTPEEEQRILAAAALGAREALRYQGRGADLGQEAALGGRLSFFVHTPSIATATTRSICGPCRSLMIIAGGDPQAAVLRVFGYDNNSVDIPASTGLYLSDAAIARVQLVVNSISQIATTMRILTSPLPHAFGAYAREDDWTPFYQRATVGTGAAGPSINLAEVGFDYEFLAASVLIVCDANAANRVIHLNVFPPDAVATDPPIGTAWVDANVVANTQGLLHAHFGGAAARFNDTGVAIIRPAAAASIEQYGQTSLPQWKGRVSAVAASPQLEVVTSNGQAGDAVSLALMGVRRPIR